MAFSSVISGKTVIGNKYLTWGTWSGADNTGGDIDTGLVVCESFIFSQKGSAVPTTDGPVVNETFPVAGSAVTIVCTSGDVGYWQAIGY